MQRDVNKNISPHPSSKELADFVEGTLDEAKKAEITKHLIACDECSDVVALVMKYGKKKLKVVNNIDYIGMAFAASVVLFILFPFSSTPFNIGEIDLSKPIMTTMSSSSKYQNRVVDGDEIVKEIENSLDKKALSHFLEAQKEETKKNYDEAIELYRKSFRDAIQTFEGREKLKWQIVIYYHISKIKFERKDEDSSSYIKRVQFWIQKYVLEE